MRYQLTIDTLMAARLKKEGGGDTSAAMVRGIDRFITRADALSHPTTDENTATFLLKSFAEQEPFLPAKPVAIPSTKTTPQTEEEKEEERIRALPTVEERGNARRAAREAKAAKTLTLDEED